VSIVHNIKHNNYYNTFRRNISILGRRFNWFMMVLKSSIQNIVTKQTSNTTDNVNANIRIEREVAKVV